MSEHQVTYINGYADAVAAGNALLCLPLELRQDIFAFAALGHIRQYKAHSRSEAANILQGRQCGWLPPMCHVNDAFFVESLPMFLRHTTMVVRESYSAYNLRFFLQATHTFASIYELRFNLSVAFTSLSAGAQLISDCINLRHVWLSFRRADFNFPNPPSQNNTQIGANAQAGIMGKVDMKSFAESYPFRQLLSLRHLEKVTLFVADDRLLALPSGQKVFWGVAPWLKRKFQRRGLAVEIRLSFFPKADAAVLQSKYSPPSPTSRPTAVAPILDVENADRAIDAWSADLTRSVYPEMLDAWAPAPIPKRPQCASDPYLFPVLTRNERLRLTMLFYYTRGVLEDAELVSRLQGKVHLARDTVGWEFVIAGLLDHNTYTRMVTVGLPMAVLPRRESTCAHTVNQPPGTIFSLLNMVEDWRFRESPHVRHGGLRAYAGVPLRFETEFGEHVAFGSLCVASNSEQHPLSQSQQIALARLADWIVADIVHSARVRRQRERRWMQELLSQAQKQCDRHEDFEEAVIETLHQVYPTSTISIQQLHNRQVSFEGRIDIPIEEFDHGLWEDVNYFDYLIENLNHQDLIAPRVVRVVGAECEDARIPTFLVVGSKDFRRVFDDVDSWWHNQALREALTAKENFLRGITHQLRTPIHGILGSVELLAEDLKSRNIIDTASSSIATPDAEQVSPHTYIKTITSSARELISTVNSLIKLNRWTEIAQAERVAALHHMEEIETALLSEITQVMPDYPDARPSVIFVQRLPPKCDSLVINLRLLIDCVQPLVVNAIQNTTGGVVAISLSIDNDYQSFTVDVKDTGCGINLDDQQRILLPYEKVDANATGAGLGLTLACKAATLMNGSISLVSSEVGKGSHFRAAFQQTACACSIRPPPPIKDTFAHLPSVFRRQSSPSSSLSLTHYFSNHLVNHGFTESPTPETPLLILECAPNLAKLRSQATQVGKEEVAICLVPESSSLFGFQGLPVGKDDNIIYVKGPFLSKTLDEALTQADSLLAGFRASKVDQPESTPLSPGLEGSFNGLQIGATALVHSDLSASRSVKPMALLVDDNIVNLRLLQMYCKRRDIPYFAATDGQQAVRFFIKHRSCPMGTKGAEEPASTPSEHTAPVELILMDLQMPLCDGITATRQIRTQESENGWSKSKIFIITGQDSASDRIDAEEAGADEYLVKPVGPKTLDQRLRHYFPGIE
ncbi:hypothetical protein K458DRAFT_399757 [Lentithecium fluviatile CBS 122367]|uniref:histidine kinase n=1 Tax=Lentithecium fluviatile CBS 122367 TaxID=1168545 RepID=A0A6G1JJ43_9PLEO|nr:hypothetical protein K458DRAFT_399757 [Lentithecium fluviatile CBS 122367]